MRYVNLTKRNTSKFQYVSKRMATVSLLSLALLSVFVVPFTIKAEFDEANHNQHLIEEDLGNDNIVVLDNEALTEIEL